MLKKIVGSFCLLALLGTSAFTQSEISAQPQEPKEQKLTVFPNPTIHEVKVLCIGEKLKQGAIKIFSLQSEDLTEDVTIDILSDQEGLLDVSNLRRGTYLIRIGKLYTFIVKS